MLYCRTKRLFNAKRLLWEGRMQCSRIIVFCLCCTGRKSLGEAIVKTKWDANFDLVFFLHVFYVLENKLNEHLLFVC